jgi:uncharacterized membrane protein YadS
LWSRFLTVPLSAAVDSEHAVTLDTILLAMAMAALGLTTHVSALEKVGAKPLLMACLSG